MYKVQRTRNVALIQQTVFIPNFVPDVERSMWLALRKDDDLCGFAVLSVDCANAARFALEFPRAPLPAEVRGLVNAAWVIAPAEIIKFTALVPVSDAATTRLYQRAGFKREGVNRHSLITPTGIEDQYYLGLQRPQEARNG